jgi:uncharacterized protein (UPF0332 family)
VIGAAYYAALYAARAALSEEDSYGKTHRGTWDLFRQTFVSTERFDGDLVADLRRLQQAREGADYEALAVTHEQASEAIALADRFVDAVGELCS